MKSLLIAEYSIIATNQHPEIDYLYKQFQMDNNDVLLHFQIFFSFVLIFLSFVCFCCSLFFFLQFFLHLSLNCSCKNLLYFLAELKQEITFLSIFRLLFSSIINNSQIKCATQNNLIRINEIMSWVNIKGYPK